ncbi:ATP-binding protein [Saccharothrix texasensis]|uniref:ATP-binding protein n=1 Tax=Saccharothrix texasensis TaxID=103734 RepID=UPI0014769BA9|nr:tetratricopeptide repeat protein [Saccharothrix texasensis]
MQAGVVHGGIAFHSAPSTPPPVPRQLLGAPAHFTDRAAELAELDEELVENRREGTRMFAVLSGPGGVGKTALALHWAHTARDRFTDGQLYVDLAGFSGSDPVPPEDALGLFLRGLGVPSREVPVEIAEQSALYRSLTADKKLLVLLDNAYSAAQVRPLAPNSPSSAVLVTSRNRLTGLVAEGARLVDVGPLGNVSAVRLLTKVVGKRRVDDDPERAEALVDMCGGLPIAVRVAAARLASRPKWSVRKVVTELSDERSRLSMLSAPELSVQTTFDLSYRALRPTAAALYRRLALHPGQEFGAPVVASVLEKDASRASLEELVDGNLVESVGESRYRFHDLLRLHARNKAHTEDEVDERAHAVRRMVEWYLGGAMAADLVVTPHRRRQVYRFAAPLEDVPEFTDRESALAWLEEERQNLIACGRAAAEQGWWALAWQLSDALWPLLLHHKHYRDRLEVDRRGVDAARRWGNKDAEADMLKRLGMVCTTLGRFTEAEEHLRASVAVAEEVGDRRGSADAEEALALLHVAGGRLREAVGLFERLVRINRELGARRNLGLTLINLGKALTGLGRTDEALRALVEATEQFRDLEPPDPYNQARVVVAQAAVHLRVDDLPLADRTARSALEALSALGSKQGMAESHHLLAESAERQGNTEEAAEHWQRALRLYTDIGSSKADGIAQRLHVDDGPQPPAHGG